MAIPKNRSDDQDYINIKGQFIKSGTSRDVYYVIGHNSCVLKYNDESGANENEATFFYDAVKNNQQEVLDCLGRVYSISKSGKYLIMEYLADVSTASEFTFNCPIEVEDPKRSNCGETTNKEIKVRDYALQIKPSPSGDCKEKLIPSKALESEMKGIFNGIKDFF